MSTFLLTAKHNMFIAPGNEIKKGESFEVHVGRPMSPHNVFNTPETRQSIIRQLAARDIDLTANRKEFFLSTGNFDVKERTNELASRF